MTHQDYLKLKPGDRVRSIDGLLYQVNDVEGSEQNRTVWFTLVRARNRARRQHGQLAIPPTPLHPTAIMREPTHP
jgi:hypothetical protein